jgi:hypothetical protein
MNIPQSFSRYILGRPRKIYISQILGAATHDSPMQEEEEDWTQLVRTRGQCWVVVSLVMKLQDA